MRARRIDGNQVAIVNALRKAGVTVAVTSRLGGGFPDLVASFAGKTVLLEVKDPSQAPSDRALTPDEQRFHFTWQGTIGVVTTWQEAWDLLRR